MPSVFDQIAVVGTGSGPRSSSTTFSARSDRPWCAARARTAAWSGSAPPRPATASPSVTTLRTWVGPLRARPSARAGRRSSSRPRRPALARRRTPRRSGPARRRAPRRSARGWGRPARRTSSSRAGRGARAAGRWPGRWRRSRAAPAPDGPARGPAPAPGSRSSSQLAAYSDGNRTASPAVSSHDGGARSGRPSASWPMPCARKSYTRPPRSPVPSSIEACRKTATCSSSRRRCGAQHLAHERGDFEAERDRIRTTTSSRPATGRRPPPAGCTTPR